MYLADSPRLASNPGYTPTVLVGWYGRHPLSGLIDALAAEGWDIRIISGGSVAPARDPSSPGRAGRKLAAPPEQDDVVDAAGLVAAARAVQPDVMIVAGTDDDPWAFPAVRALRSDPLTHDMGLVLFPYISVPEDLDITPMGGPDAWVFLDARMAQAMETVRRTVRAALEGRLEWAQRDWAPEDRRRHAIKSVALRVEHGRLVPPELLSEALYGPQARVDLRVWEPGSPHVPGWRFGCDDRYGRPLLIRYQPLEMDEDEIGDQRFTLHSRSGLLLLAACHLLAELSGGWPTLE